jgi:CheY-like chemotaxis protein
MLHCRNVAMVAAQLHTSDHFLVVAPSPVQSVIDTELKAVLNAHSIAKVESGRDAIKACHAFRPNTCVIIDARPPVGTSLLTIREIRNLMRQHGYDVPPFQPLIIVVNESSSDATVGLAYLGQGADAVLSDCAANFGAFISRLGLQRTSGVDHPRAAHGQAQPELSFNDQEERRTAVKVAQSSTDRRSSDFFLTPRHQAQAAQDSVDSTLRLLPNSSIQSARMPPSQRTQRRISRASISSTITNTPLLMSKAAKGEGGRMMMMDSSVGTSDSISRW